MKPKTLTTKLNSFRTLAGTGLVISLTQTGTFAQTTRTWTGTTDGNLNTSTNWSTAGSPTTNDTLIFGNDATTSGANALSMNAVVGGATGVATVTVSQSNALDFTASSTSNGLRLNSGGTFTVNAGAGQVTFSNNARLVTGTGSGTQSFTLTNNSSNAVVIASTASSNWIGGTGTRNLTFTGSGNWTFDKMLNPTFTSGNVYNVIKGGSGVMTINAAGGNTNNFTIANGGGTVAITNGGALAGSLVQIGQTGGNDAIARLQLSNNITVANTINIVGQLQNSAVANARIQNVSGDNTLSGNVTFNGTGGIYTNLASTAGTLTLGGNLTASSVTGSRYFHFTGDGGFISNGVVSNGSATVGIVKSGAGTLTLNGVNTYSGLTTVSAGSIEIGSTGSIANTSGVALNGGNFNVSAVTGGYALGALQTLSGSGTVTGDLTVNGTLAIGASPGTITFNDDLTLGGGSVSNFEFTVGAFTAGSFDLALGGASAQTVVFGGTLNLFFDSGETYLDNSSVKIFDFESYSGNFSSVTFTGLGTGQSATFDSSTGFVTVIPEPTAAALGSIGLLFLLRRRR